MTAIPEKALDQVIAELKEMVDNLGGISAHVECVSIDISRIVDKLEDLNDHMASIAECQEDMAASLKLISDIAVKKNLELVD